MCASLVHTVDGYDVINARNVTSVCPNVHPGFCHGLPGPLSHEWCHSRQVSCRLLNFNGGVHPCNPAVANGKVLIPTSIDSKTACHHGSIMLKSNGRPLEPRITWILLNCCTERQCNLFLNVLCFWDVFVPSMGKLTFLQTAGALFPSKAFAACSWVRKFPSIGWT